MEDFISIRTELILHTKEGKKMSLSLFYSGETPILIGDTDVLPFSSRGVLPGEYVRLRLIHRRGFDYIVSVRLISQYVPQEEPRGK